MSFSDFKLEPPILKAVSLCGYTAPTPIQEQAIPKALAGHDLIASAQTGTGKLVLTPTRELANQITDAIHTYGRFMRTRSGAILGGMPYGKQEQLLSQPVDMIVATPGRLIDHMERGRINFSRLELLVVDEADRMLDIGFSEAVKTIAATTPVSRQTLLFAATWDKSVEKLAQHILKSPVRVEIAGKKVTLEEIEQRLHTADSRSHKNRILKHLIADSSMTRAIIFSSTKRNADSLARELYNQGHAAAALHGDMKQNARNRTTMNMRRGKIRLLVATDVASRLAWARSYRRNPRDQLRPAAKCGGLCPSHRPDWPGRRFGNRHISCFIPGARCSCAHRTLHRPDPATACYPGTGTGKNRSPTKRKWKQEETACQKPGR
jgi:superfamily II DNA/RNA helicase